MIDSTEDMAATLLLPVPTKEEIMNLEEVAESFIISMLAKVPAY